MAASGKTPNFNIPIYNSGDTANYLTSYNNAMSIVDTQMQANKTAAAAAQSAVTNIEATIATQEEAITELKQTSNNNTVVWVSLASQSENVNSVNFQQFGHDSKIAYVTGSWNINKPFNEIPNITTNGSETWVPLAYAADPNNKINITPGISNRILNPSASFVFVSGGTSTFDIATLGLWKIGTNVYIGVDTSNIAAGNKSGTMKTVNTPGTWFKIG